MPDSGGVEVQVRSQLSKIVADLESISEAQKSVKKLFEEMSGDIGKQTKAGSKAVEKQLEETKSFGRRVADQLKKDFMTLASVQSLLGGLSLSSMFAGSVKETLVLSDTVRRLGHVFGMARSEFSSFQSAIQRGFGDIGLSSEAAANAIQGLSETSVRGQDRIIDFAKSGAQLASISGQKGTEGAVAKGLVDVIQSRGGDVRRPEELRRAEQEVLQIQTATGKGASEITKALSSLYSKTSVDFKQQMAGGAAVTLAAAAVRAPEGTAFLERFVGMTTTQRMAAESQGLGKLMTSEGKLDPAAFSATLAEARKRMPHDVEAGLGTLGIQPGEEAKGFMRLTEELQRNATMINSAVDANKTLEGTFRDTMGATDSFRASLNKLKSTFSDSTSSLTQTATDILSGASETTGGAAAVAGGAAVTSAVLTGVGLKGIGAGLGLAAPAAGGAGAAVAGAGTATAAAGGALAAGAAAGGLAIGTGLLASKGFEYIASGQLESDLKRSFKSAFGKDDGYTGTIPLPATMKHEVVVKPSTPNFDKTRNASRGSGL